MSDRVLLVDGLNSIWRANIAFKQKLEVGKESFIIVYNFFKNLRASIEEFQPTKVFFCLEGKDNFRYKIFSEYKANRVKFATEVNNKKHEDFHRQKQIIIDLLSHLPITTVKANQFECDDVIASLVENLKNEELIILSNDSDFIQLLQKGYKNLKIYNPFKKEYMVAPEYHYLTWKCLAGDKQTDNIPGLVGAKTAEKIASDINALGEFISSEENIANYRLNKQLIELQIIKDEDLILSEYQLNFEEIKKAFAVMEFKSLLEEKYWNRFCETFIKLR